MGKPILVVDPDPNSKIVDCLAIQGYEVASLFQIDEAKLLLGGKGARETVVVCWHKLPDFNSHGLFMHLLCNHPGLEKRFIAVTADSDPFAAGMLAQQGMRSVHYVGKESDRNKALLAAVAEKAR